MAQLMGSGARLGPYEIVALIGAGGMGEVYRARDTKLNRDVAIKVLPELFALDLDRLARFKREAQVLASVNHPNIAMIHGFEDSSGVQALVLELVEGPTLADRIAQGPIPIDEALPIARQIADALEGAHELGIIHRDLKPANIKLRPDGTVKVLDFGLAKALEPVSALWSDLTVSPTITTPAMTGIGVILGTAAYMSPEQAKGRPADKRSDIWGFGCVLFEMLTGKQTFGGGDSVAEAVAAILKNEPDWSALPAETPAYVRALLRRCLEKDLRRRLRDIGDARFELDAPPITFEANEAGKDLRAHDGRSATRRAVFVSSIVALIAGSMVAAAVTWIAMRAPDRTQPVGRFTMPLPADAPLDLAESGRPWASLAISRDGRAIAYVALTREGRQLYVRRSDDLAPQAIEGTVGVWEAFFSPDGQWLGFIAADRLKKVAVTGGRPVVVADTPNLNSGVWADDGTIYLGGRAGLMRVSSEGKVQMLAKPQSNEVELHQPDLLPDGSVLFTIMPDDVTSFDDARIAVLTPRGERRVVIEGGGYARYSPTGHIVYARGGQVMAVPFDVRRLAVTGQPVAVARGAMFNTATARATMAFSRTGTLVYAPGGPVPNEKSLAWVDRRGAVTPVQATRRFYAEPRVSPNGLRIAFTIRAANDDIWVYDVGRNAFTRLTFTHGNNQAPIWSPDGTRVVYALDHLGVRTLAWRPADGTGSEEQLTSTQFFQTPGSWSPDGKLLAYAEGRPDRGSDLFVLPMEGERKPREFLATAFSESTPMFSPDGHWIAFESDETGHLEVFVAPYPGPGRKWQISDAGGMHPAWTRDGSEIVYRQGDRLMSVAITTAPMFQPGIAREILKLPPQVTYFAMTPDGQRCIVIRRDGQPLVATELHVVLNWHEELKRLVSVK